MTPADKQAAIRARREMMKAAGRRLPRKRRPRAQLHPTAIERSYRAELLRLTEPFFDQIKKSLVPVLGEIVSARNEDLKADAMFSQKEDGYGEMIGKVFDGIRLNVAARVTDEDIREAAGRFATRTSDFNKGQVDGQFSSVLGIPVLRQEKWLRPKIEAFVFNNVGLIKDITDKAARDLQVMIMARVEAGDSVRALEKAIQKKLDTTKSRARFIARDQVSSLNGKLTELRQTEAGVEEYIWRSTNDGADRPSHLANNGKRFRWDDPPDTGHPGEDFQCRCTAEPVLDEFMEYKAKEKKAA